MEIDRDPVRMELSVAPRMRDADNPHAFELWVYEPGIVEGDLVHMGGAKRNPYSRAK